MIIDDPEIMVVGGFTVLGTSPEELGTRTRAQLAKYQKLMKEAGIKGE